MSKFLDILLWGFGFPLLASDIFSQCPLENMWKMFLFFRHCFRFDEGMTCSANAIWLLGIPGKLVFISRTIFMNWKSVFYFNGEWFLMFSLHLGFHSLTCVDVSCFFAKLSLPSILMGGWFVRYTPFGSLVSLANFFLSPMILTSWKADFVQGGVGSWCMLVPQFSISCFWYFIAMWQTCYFGSHDFCQWESCFLLEGGVCLVLRFSTPVFRLSSVWIRKDLDGFCFYSNYFRLSLLMGDFILKGGGSFDLSLAPRFSTPCFSYHIPMWIRKYIDYFFFLLQLFSISLFMGESFVRRMKLDALVSWQTCFLVLYDFYELESLFILKGDEFLDVGLMLRFSTPFNILVRFE